ncbi:hypothetical protein BJ138DRAFT_1200449, partial [Hygrophoropsis aurantiaca]
MDPRVELPPCIDELDEATFDHEFRMFVERLAVECNWHTHTETCWKHLKSKSERSDATCRMRMDGTTKALTELDPETLSIMLKRLHPWINNFNELILFLLQCNMDIKYIGSGEAAKALVYYVTDYISKTDLQTHVGLAALTYAIKSNNTKFEDNFDSSALQKDRSLITKTVNSIMSRQEMSHQQIMAYFVNDGPSDYYTSHRFELLRYHDFDRYLKSLQTDAGSLTAASGGDQHSLDPHLLGSNDDDESEIQNEEQVALSVQKGEISVSSDVMDYRFRPISEPFNKFSLWEHTQWSAKTSASDEERRLAR